MNPPVSPVERVIGLDAHPDSFTASVLRGPTPAAAIVEKTFNKVPIDQLQKWARTHLGEGDLVVLEASGNSFHLAHLGHLWIKDPGAEASPLPEAGSRRHGRGRPLVAVQRPWTALIHRCRRWAQMRPGA